MCPIYKVTAVLTTDHGDVGGNGTASSNQSAVSGDPDASRLSSGERPASLRPIRIAVPIASQTRPPIFAWTSAVTSKKRHWRHAPETTVRSSLGEVVGP